MLLTFIYGWGGRVTWCPCNPDSRDTAYTAGGQSEQTDNSINQCYYQSAYQLANHVITIIFPTTTPWGIILTVQQVTGPSHTPPFITPILYPLCIHAPFCCFWGWWRWAIQSYSLAGDKMGPTDPSSEHVWSRSHSKMERYNGWDIVWELLVSSVKDGKDGNTNDTSLRGVGGSLGGGGTAATRLGCFRARISEHTPPAPTTRTLNLESFANLWAESQNFCKSWTQISKLQPSKCQIFSNLDHFGPPSACWLGCRVWLVGVKWGHVRLDCRAWKYRDFDVLNSLSKDLRNTNIWRYFTKKK